MQPSSKWIQKDFFISREVNYNKILCNAKKTLHVNVWETFLMGMLKKAASLRKSYGLHASGVPCLRRAYFAEVVTKAESGYAQANGLF